MSVLAAPVRFFQPQRFDSVSKTGTYLKIIALAHGNGSISPSSSKHHENKHHRKSQPQDPSARLELTFKKLVGLETKAPRLSVFRSTLSNINLLLSHPKFEKISDSLETAFLKIQGEIALLEAPHLSALKDIPDVIDKLDFEADKKDRDLTQDSLKVLTQTIERLIAIVIHHSNVNARATASSVLFKLFQDVQDLRELGGRFSVLDDLQRRYDAASRTYVYRHPVKL